MKYTLSTFCILAIFWLGNSGHYSILLLGLGLASILLVIFVARRMDFIDHESLPLHLGRKLPAYYVWLVGKLIRSNIDVAYRAWGGGGAISPTVARLPVKLESDMAKVIYANSITLTPGTVAMDLDSDSVLVHALTREGIEELRGGEMHRKVAELEAR